MKATRHGRVDFAEVCCTSDSLLSGAVTSLVGHAVQYNHWNGINLTTKAGTDTLKEDLLEKKPRVVWMTPPCTTQRTQQSRTRSKFHRKQVNILFVFSLACGARLVRSDSGTDVGFDESWSWRCLLRVGRTVSQWWNTWTSVTSLMGRFSWYSSVHIDVGQICCVPDEVFVVFLIQRWRKERCSTHCNSSRQL